MRADEFVKKVSERAGIADREQAKRATEAVLETLRARISHRSGDNVAAQLPADLKQMWESGTLEHLFRSMTGVERMDLGAFLARVAAIARLADIRQAETVTRAVFITMREQITEGAQKTVESELPDDIRQFWEDSRPGAEAEGPFEMEAPVEPTPEEMAGARTWGPETDLPSGSDVEMAEAQIEAQVRDLGGRDILGMAAGPETPGEEERAEPPAAERVEIVPPPGERESTAGPGSDAYYRADAELTQEIEQMLGASDEVDASDINVFVQAGNVVLRGHVKTAGERDAASHIAARALGVGDIRNELGIETQR